MLNFLLIVFWKEKNSSTLAYTKASFPNSVRMSLLHTFAKTREAKKKKRQQKSIYNTIYLNALGRSSIAFAVATIWISCSSSEGAMTTIYGRQAMNVMSKAPQ